ncbi:DUF92 domain-containing protein [Paenibacillus hexagrammi]|uniref:DUF92 domain-containing protein n=1 Tax=Paenibacillus hexagrammi TaxID=2908839 RepID=A0ABY3SCF7_9BACL|nr:DUF92 domain-containing protein [Paenibacillus sp. YPD9-1]UJF31628.1 DUF92 domain-containing protein [Paenibacillus sp. YPD9-1]
MVGVWGLGFIGSILIAGLAYWRRSLSMSGFIGAVGLGTWMYAAGSLPWFGTLIAFFISSTLLSKVKHAVKAEAESGYAKGGRRDAGQVAANGGLALLLCIFHSIWPHTVWWCLFLGVMATVNADTWATEIGGMSRSVPRSILNGRKVAAGTSGGITALGIGASVAGGAFIGAVACVLMAIRPGSLGEPWYFYMLAAAIAGFVGSLADSFLGATLQTMYHCETCGKVIEKRVHCGQSSKQVRGFKWMTNDGVNALSSLVGGAVSWLLYLASFPY